MEDKINKQNMIPIILVILGIFLRLMPHIPNFAPITATALFGGVYLKKRYALVLPLLIMAVSDYLINPADMFHSTTFFVWGSFLISGVIGLWVRKHNKPGFILGASLIASLQFFLITNFGVWAMGMYSRGLDGLLQSYIMGIPFYRYTLLGDLFYTTTLFSSYSLIRWIVKKLQPALV